TAFARAGRPRSRTALVAVAVAAAAALVGAAVYAGLAPRARGSLGALVAAMAPGLAFPLLVSVATDRRPRSLPAAAWAIPLVGVALGDAVVAGVAVGVRQWRFAPGPRRRDVTLLGAAFMVVTGSAAWSFARNGWGPAATAGALAVVVLVGWPGARLADTVRRG